MIILHGVRGTNVDWVGGDVAWWDEVGGWVAGWSITEWLTAHMAA